MGYQLLEHLSQMLFHPLLCQLLGTQLSKVREMGNHGNPTELFERCWIVGMGRAVENDSEHIQIAAAQSFEAQQCVIQGPKSAPSYQNNGAGPTFQLIKL